MEYKKIIKENYNIHIINTDRFKTISMNVAFSNKFDKSDIPYLNLLIKNLVSSTKKYKTSSSLAILGEELYGSSISASFNIISNIERMIISLDFLNPKYTEQEMIKESISFFNECLFNPNIINNGFAKKHFDINKDNIINSLKSINDNSYSYSLIKFKNVMYDETYLSYNLYNNIQAIEKISNKDLYSFYLNVIKNFKIDIFLVGNLIDEEEYIKCIDKMFSSQENIFNKNLRFKEILLNTPNKVIKEQKEFNQSQLFVGYTFDNLNDYEKKYVLSYYNGILGGINNSILFTDIRENNSLCYTIDSFITRDPYSLVIETEIDKKNYDKTNELIDEAIQKMSNKELISSLINTTKENINTSLNNFYDNIITIIDYYYRKEFEEVEDIETRRKNYMKVTVEDIVNLNKKIRKCITYFLEGDMNE